MNSLKKISTQFYYQLSLKCYSRDAKRKIVKNIARLKRLKYVERNQLKTVIKEILIRLDCIKENKIDRCCKLKSLLKYIIGNDYFGTNKNRNQFFLVVDRVLTQSRYECIHKCVLFENYDYDNISWLSDYNDVERRRLLEKYNIFLLDFIVKPLIRHFYFPLADYKSYDIKLIPRAKWNAFKDKVHNELIRTGVMSLIKCSNTRTIKPRGFLKIVPKSDNLKIHDYRPLVALIDKNKSVMLRYKQKLDLLTKDLTITKTNLYLGWKTYVEVVGKKAIYGIKIDLLDAFGNINIDILSNIIINTDRFSTQEKEFLTSYIKEQYILSNGKKIYQWHQGLIQGDRLSTRLCNLYLAHMESKHLKDFMHTNNFLHRTVDDIFFCSTNLQEVFDFELKASQVFLLNEKKTVKILHWSDDDNSLCYCGHIFNLKTKEVIRRYGFQPRTNIQHKFKIWNAIRPIEKPSTFIANAMRFSSSNSYFSKYLLNTSFNSTATVLKNYFQGMCFVSFKFVTVIDAIIYKILGNEHFTKFIFRHIQKIIHMYSRKACHIIQTYKGPKYKSVNFELLENIACKAFIVVCKTRFSLYRFVVDKLKKVSGRRLPLKDINVSPKYFFTLPEDFRNIISRKKFKV